MPFKQYYYLVVIDYFRDAKLAVQLAVWTWSSGES